MNLINRIFSWLFGPWFHVSDPATRKEVIGQRGWNGELFLTVRDDVYEIRCTINPEVIPQIAEWLRNTSPPMSTDKKNNIIKLVPRNK